MNDRKIIIGILSAIILEFTFGFSFFFMKNAMVVASILSILCWRYIVGFGFMTAAMLLGFFKVSFKGKSKKTLIILSLLSPVICILSEIIGVELTTVSESGTLAALLPLSTVLTSTLIIKKPPTKFQVIGILVSLLGVMTIVLIKGFEALLNPIGYFAMIISVVSFSVYSVLSSQADEFSSIEKTYLVLLAGVISFVPMAIVEHLVKGSILDLITLPFVNWDFFVSTIYLGIFCSALAYALVNLSIDYLGSNRAAVFSGLSAVISVWSGVILLGEKFSFRQGVATAFVIAGIYIANITVKAKVLEAGATEAQVKIKIRPEAKTCSENKNEALT